MKKCLELLLFFPGYLISLAAQRSNGSALYKKEENSLGFLLSTVGFTVLCHFVWLSLFLSHACGPARSQLVACHEPGNAMEQYSAWWPILVAAYDSSFYYILVLAALIAFVLQLAQARQEQSNE